jgi:hypothetical protein
MDEETKAKTVSLVRQEETKVVNISELSQQAYSTEERLQVQEIVEEKQKNHQKMMDKLIEDHKDYDPEGYYIVVLSKNDYNNVNVIKTKYIVRATKPRADWSQDLYYYDNKNDVLHFIYSLPKQEDTVYFKKNADLFKREWVEPYLKMIDAMLDGTLDSWDAPGKKPQESVLYFDAKFGVPSKKLIL